MRATMMGLSLSVFLLPGCAAWMANQGATAELQLGFVAANQRAALAEAELESVREQVASLEALLRDQGLGQANGLASIDQMMRDLAGLRGRVEELEFALNTMNGDFTAYQLSQESRQLRDEARLHQLERLLGVSPPASGTGDNLGAGDAASAPDTPPEAGASAPAGDGEPESGAGADEGPAEALTAADKLTLAESRMADGNQVAARAILEAAITTWPDDPLLSVLRYRVGETLFNEAKWKEAARAFQSVTDQHATDHTWASMAMLRIGECFDELGRPDGARTFYDGVVRKYPDTEAARLAKQKLGN